MSSITVHTLDGNVLPESAFAYRTVSVDRLADIQRDVESILNGPDLSNNETFRSYIENKKYAVPESFPEAKSVIILAVFTPMALVNFQYDGGKKQVVVPPQYYSMFLTEEIIQETIQQKIIRDPGFRVENANRLVLLKRLAVQSGLAEYGRNNITYVGSMGSFHTLHAYFTDCEFDENSWNEVKMMERCDNCRLCQNNCPTGAIGKDSFVIDAGRCITLYNEVLGDFPEWIPKDAHNALMGCLRCQADCPENSEAIANPVYLQDISENETKSILEGTPDEETLQILSQKLNKYSPTSSLEYFPIFTRNLGALLQE
ncbi:MAG: 4Fe-4S double cluster binding domain-containing protein [Candidatus Thorarchaeota archaeon]|jgi:epoxyqueuosine reductase